MPALELYDVVLALHIMAVVIAFGVTFAYPVLVPFVRRNHPQAMPALHAGQELIGKRVISPGLVLILVFGIYLASKADVWSQVWVTVPFVILIILGGLGGAFFGPNEKRLAELARRDLDAGGTFSPEYEALSARVAMVGGISSLLVLVAIFFMAAKPG